MLHVLIQPMDMLRPCPCVFVVLKTYKGDLGGYCIFSLWKELTGLSKTYWRGLLDIHRQQLGKMLNWIGNYHRCCCQDLRKNLGYCNHVTLQRAWEESVNCPNWPIKSAFSLADTHDLIMKPSWYTHQNWKRIILTRLQTMHQTDQKSYIAVESIQL